MTNGARRIPLAAGDGGSVVSDRIVPGAALCFSGIIVALKKKKTWPKNCGHAHLCKIKFSKNL